jgi:hypothetical protein
MINEILTAGKFHTIILHLLHDWIFVDFFGLTEGLKHCYIVYKN